MANETAVYETTDPAAEALCPAQTQSLTDSVKPEKTDRTTLITGARGFLGKYFMREFSEASIDPLKQIATLGRSPHNDIIADLTDEVPAIERRYDSVIHLVGTCGEGNPHKLNTAATGNLLAALEPMPPKAIVYISTTEVYGATEGIDLTEGTVVDPATEVGVSKLETERMLAKWCGERGVTLTILRCPAIVGTGMKGWLRKLVNGIYRATYHHVSDETQRVSVVHAVDVARAASLLLDKGGVYNMTDGEGPTMRDLSEALAYRIDDKRIFTISAKRAKTLARIGRYLPVTGFTPATLADRYRSLTFSNAKLVVATGWTPNRVTTYLRTHTYDESSL